MSLRRRGGNIATTMKTPVLRTALHSLAVLTAFFFAVPSATAQPRGAFTFTGVEQPVAGQAGRFWTTPGGQTQIRGSLVVTQLVSPEFGTLYNLIEINAHFGSDFAGPVWGTWALFTANPLEHPESILAEGSWSGFRSRVSEALWISQLKVVGRFIGGPLAGGQLRATEKITTTTPWPAPFLGEISGYVWMPGTPKP